MTIADHARRFVTADTIISYIDDHGILAEQDGDFSVDHRLRIYGIDFYTTFRRHPNRGISLFTMTLERVEAEGVRYVYTQHLGPDFVAYKIKGDTEQLDRDLMHVVVGGAFRPDYDRLDQAERGLKASVNPPRWVPSQWAMVL